MAAAVTPPLTLGEILDRTIQLYRRNFLLFVGISLAPSACYVLIYGSVSLYLTSHAVQMQGTPNLQLMLTFMGVIAGFLLFGLPLLAAVSTLSLSALNFAANQRNSQKPVTVYEAYAYAWKRFWRYLGILSMQLLFALAIPGAVFAGVMVIGVVSATFLVGAGVNPGADPKVAVLFSLLFLLLGVTFLVAAVLIWLRFSLAFPASLVEDLKIWPSMQRSNRLSKGSRGRIFVMYMLVAILVAVLYYALVLPVDLAIGLIFFKSSQWVFLLSKPPLVLQVVNLFISFLQRAFAIPVYAIALLLFYNDQRTRQEGYDIELLMAQAGWSTLPASSALPPVDSGFFARAEAVPAWTGAATTEPRLSAAGPVADGFVMAPSATPAIEAAYHPADPLADAQRDSAERSDSPAPPPEATGA